MTGKIDFKLELISGFDARRGLKRCKLPGVGVSFADARHADADLWRDRSGGIVTRFTSQGYQYSFRVVDASGMKPSDDQLDVLGDHLAELLSLWLIEGVDDTPSTEIT